MLSGGLALERGAAAEPEGRVVVIGAGIAGLAAARRLKEQGYSVIVVEGRDRIGGRIWTDKSAGVPIDLGAAWIHGISGNPIYKLSRKNRLPLFKTDFDAQELYESGRPLTKAQWDRIEKEYEKLTDELDARKRGAGKNASLADALRPLLARVPAGVVRRGVRYNVASDMEIEYASDLDELSLKYFDEDEAFPGDDMLFSRGFAGLTDALAAGLDVRTGQRVNKIEYSARGVKIHTSRGGLDCDWAVVTLPLGVLKKEAVTFAPALPADKHGAIARLGMGTMNKVALVFPRSFWPAQAHRFGRLKDDERSIMEFWNLEPVVGRPALAALSAGDFARSLDRGSVAAAVARAMGELKAMFGNGIPAPVAFTRTAWSSDPFAYGSYAHVAPGASLDDFEIMARPVADRLFFAGEHTHEKYPATVHGAYLSGIRAAREVDAD